MERQSKNVVDWGKSTMHDQYKEQIDELLKNMNELPERLKEDWKLAVDKKDKKVYLATKERQKNSKEITCYSKVTVDACASLVFKILNNVDIVKQTDPNIDKIKILEQDYHNRYVHTLFKSLFYQPPREAVTYDNWYVDETGTIYKTLFSIDRDEIPVDKEKKILRAYTKAWTKITPDKYDDNKTTIETKMDLNLRLEDLPGWILKMVGPSMVTKNALDKINQMESYLKKHIKKAPSSHIVLNEGGKTISLDGGEEHQEKKEEGPIEFSDLQLIDIFIPVVLIFVYSLAVYIPVSELK